VHDDATLAIAVEENAAEFLLAMGHAGGGDERCDDVHWSIGGSPIAYHNCVVRADLAPEDADDAIVDSRERMRELGVPGSWHVGPLMRPADLVERLGRHGFEGGPEPGMAADVEAIPAIVEPTGFAVERVLSEDGLDAFEAVLGSGFGEGPKEAAWVRTVYGRMGLGDDVPCHHFLGRLDGRPVATATLYVGAGAGGIYFVSTAPDFRRRGFGAAVSRAAMLHARELGEGIAVLGSSPMGHGVYRRLGFRDVCTVHVLEWTPD
jgi:ribosomal protein S18 acetylase RimI-like enzyme